MAEYIEKKKLVKFACRHVDGKLDANDIARFPTADVVPVVRCKDCKHFNIGVLGLNWCAAHSYDELIECKENDYCSYGERRSNDD